MPPGRLRPAGPGRADAGHRPPRGHGHRHRDAVAVAVRPEPAVRLRRPVRLRGRLPHRRAARGRPLARPGPARRAARAGRAPRAARPRGAGRGRGRAPAARARPQGARRRGPGRHAATARPAHHRGGDRAGPRRQRRRRVAGRPGRARGAWSRSAWPARSAGAWSRTSAACATASAWRCRPAPPRRSPTPSTTRSPTWSARYARTHGPFTTDQVADRLGLGAAVVRHTLQRLAAQGRVLDGEFRPSGSGSEWCDAEVLRKLRRRSLARLRKEVEPVEPEALGRFLGAWQRLNGKLRGVDGVVSAIDQLAGCPVPASALEPLVLGSRVRDYEPSYLDELTASGEVVWAGHSALPGLRRLGLAPPRRPGVADPARADAVRALASCTRRCSTPSRRAAPGSSGRSPTPCGPRPTRHCRPHCGTWSGRAGSATTPWSRCAR